MHRYDALLIAALTIQAVLLALRLERWSEAAVIIVFHVVATGMELFKTSPAIGAWHYPDPALLAIGGVPLFAGFMYSAVGSYIARVWRIFRFSFTRFPPLWTLGVLSVAIYANFFTHHWLPDIRWALIAILAWLLRATHVHFTVLHARRSMHLLLGLALVALFIWFAENIATWGRVWLYPSQDAGWTPVSAGKITAWFLLMTISFTLVAAIHRRDTRFASAEAADGERA
jgi:uncharacterized membrane protein YoaT (DUF817 family)